MTSAGVVRTTRTEFEHDEFWLDVETHEGGSKDGVVEWAAVPKNIGEGSSEVRRFKTEQEARNWIKSQSDPSTDG